MVSWADRGRERVPPQYAIPRGVLSHEVGIFLALREMVTEGWELSCLLSTREVSVQPPATAREERKRVALSRREAAFFGFPCNQLKAVAYMGPGVGKQKSC